LNVAYSQTFTASNGNAPYVFSLVSGSLPPGLTFNSGVLSGTPTTLGSYSFTIKATDVYSCESNNLPITMAVKTLCVGNMVFVDINNDGTRQSTESGVPALRIQLWGPGTNGILENGGGDYVQQGADMLTDSNGMYLFTNLLPGVYYVRIPAPPAFYPAVSTNVVALDNGVNNDNNGMQSASGAPVVSPLITLTPGGEPGTGVDGDDTDCDSTIDFGFANTDPCYSNNLIDNPSFEFQGLPNLTGTAVSVLGYNGTSTSFGAGINAYRWTGGTNGTSGIGEPIQRAQVLAGTNGSRVSWVESLKSRHGRRMLLLEGTNSCVSLRAAGGGAWSSVLQPGREYELSV